jgi:AcrR family transcriptional regulator
MDQLMKQEKPVISEEANSHRRRLLEGMGQAVAEKGYADTTIADIVAAAGVSRRTFYEHFKTKSQCLIALYSAASSNALEVLRTAIDPAHDWETQVERAISAYFSCLGQNPVLLRTLFIEILGLGEEGLAARRRVNQALADFMLQVINVPARARRNKPPLQPEIAMAVVGGINELILEAIERNRTDRLQELVSPSLQLVRSVT